MIKLIESTILIAFLLIAFSLKAQNPYLHVEGKSVIDASGKEVILRGMGLGGWMLQEGYMLETSRFAGPQHQIKSTIDNTVGKEGMDAFYDAWLANYCTKKDIDSMAAWGFNSIRLPMHYNLFTLSIEDESEPGKDTWINKGFVMVDSLLDWCADNNIYLILDLHAAPGGQGKDANISDYDETKPSLWESEENRRKTAALWKKLADRYKNEKWMGGYDIINEPNWDFDSAGNKNGCDCTQNEMLWEFYALVINAIREVDQNHLVIIEGNCWGNNYKGAPDPNTFDKNLIISFHKYWNYNTQKEIQYILDMRDQYNLPIWLGESGENSNTWFTNAINLMEMNKIGWAWWPYKKINSVTGTVTIPKTNGYQNLLNYWNGKGEKPSVEQANEWLMEQAEMMKLENCIIHYDVIDAMFRQAQGDKSTRPFTKKNIIPGIIYASNYDLGANGFAYFDTDTCNFRVSTNNSTGWNNGRKYRNDGVDIQECNNKESNGYSVGWTEKGEWLSYSIYAEKEGNYELTIQFASDNDKGSFRYKVGNNELSEISKLQQTGGGDVFSAYILKPKIKISKGINQFTFYIEEGGFNLSSFQFMLK